MFRAQTRAAALAAAMIVLVVAAGCRSSSPNRGAIPQRSEAFVRVENRSMLDMTVYVIRGSERRRLGLVNALSTETIPIPPGLIEGAGILRFLADPIGGNRTPVSEEISVRDGDVVTLLIPPQ